MTDPTTQGPAPAQPAAPRTQPKGHAHPPSVIIRPWPKVIFLYPVFLVATVFWVLSLFSDVKDGQLGFRWMGNTFVLVFFFNMLVFAFDFSRIKSIAIIFGIIALVFGLFWANQKYNTFDSLGKALSGVNIQMNTWFYGSFSAMLGLVLLLVLINTRFNYYEVNHREILHHHGYLGDVTRMPTTGLRLNKEIYDLLEFALLRSGRLIFYPSTSREAIIVDNVLNVNHAEDRIKDLLSVVAVRSIDNEPH